MLTPGTRTREIVGDARFARSFEHGEADDAARRNSIRSAESPTFERANSSFTIHFVHFFQRRIPALFSALPPSLPAQGRFYRDPLVKALGNLG